MHVITQSRNFKTKLLTACAASTLVGMFCLNPAAQADTLDSNDLLCSADLDLENTQTLRYYIVIDSSEQNLGCADFFYKETVSGTTYTLVFSDDGSYNPDTHRYTRIDVAIGPEQFPTSDCLEDNGNGTWEVKWDTHEGNHCIDSYAIP